MIVSYSEVFKWDTCKRQYYYNFGLGLRPQEESDTLSTGIKGHQLLQAFYEAYRSGESKEAALALTLQKAKHMMDAEGAADFPLLKSWTMVDNYIRATDFTSEAVLVENRFLIPFSELDQDPAFDHMLIGFTPDVVFERKGGYFDVEDSKFVVRAWSASKIKRFQQAKLYQIFLRRMGYNITRSSIRFFNTTTNTIKSQDYILTKEEEKSIIYDFTEGVKEVVRYRSQNEDLQKLARRTMNYTACQYCAFEHPCTLEAEGKDASKTLKNLYKKSDYDYTR